MLKDLASKHPISHVSLLKKCNKDPTLVFPLESVHMKDTLSYEEVPIKILDCQAHKFRNKHFSSIKCFGEISYLREIFEK